MDTHRLSSSTVKDPLPLSRITSSAVNGLVIALWFALFWPIYDNLATIFTREDFRTSQMALIGALILIGLRMKRDRLHVRLDAPIRVYTPALALALGGATAFVAVERLLDINTLAMGLFGLGTYGLLGLWMRPQTWRNGFPAALLLVGVLPLGDYLDVFVGYPMRIATASLVRDGLATIGVNSISIDTILVFENGVSQIDLPCSGVKSLWTGMLFLLAATWIESRALNLRWLLVAGIFAALLFVANLIRVAVLVTVGQVLAWRMAADLIHVPLGVLGFVAACVAAVYLLRLMQPSKVAAPGAVSNPPPSRTTLPWPSVLIVLVLLGLNLINNPRQLIATTGGAVQVWTLPNEFNAKPVQLRSGEVDWLLRDGAESVTRIRFNWRGVTGSLLLVPSTNWRAHHNPERCLENDGLHVEQATTHLVAHDQAVKFLTLSNGKPGGRLSATYWFQSAGRATDDYGTRLWSALSLKPERWVLVSVLFDEVRDPHSDELETLYLALQETVRAQLVSALTQGL